MCKLNAKIRILLFCIYFYKKNIYEKNSYLETSLFGAIKNNHSEVVKILLEHGASITKRDSEGRLNNLPYILGY